MNSALPEMLHCLQRQEIMAENGTDITVLERQQARLKWQFQPQQSYLDDTHFNIFANSEQFQSLLNNEAMKEDPGLENGYPGFGKYPLPSAGFGGDSSGYAINSVEMVDHSLSRTSSCPPAVAGRNGVVENLAAVVGRESFKKRKADKALNLKGVISEESREKRSKVESDEESKVTEQKNNRSNSNTTTITTTNNNKENSGESSKENSKCTGPQKSDYIHVRARRGQATDSHSLAERVRREKISERMKYLQDLVPGCNKITGKAGMLDEIINYVQSLQRQVEFLSMKLATVNPRLDFNIENFFAKEMYPACTGGFQPTGISSEMANCSAYIPFNPVQEQAVSCCGLDMVINPPDPALRRTISAPISLPDPSLLNTSCFTQAQPSSTWETDLQSLYNVFPPQSFTETLQANNLKMEM